MKKNFKNQGFTLFEVIIVIFLFSMISVAGTSMFFSILKTTTKAEIEKELKQNGTYAITSMENMIRNARSIVNCETSVSDRYLIIQNQHGTTNKLECVYDNVAQTAAIASDSGVITNNALTGTNVTVSAPGEGCGGSTLVFNCLNTIPQSVGIGFTLRQAVIGGKVEDQASVSFQTSVSLRNY